MDSHETYVSMFNGNKIGEIFVACSLAVNGFALYFIGISILFMGIFWYTQPKNFVALAITSVTTVFGFLNLLMWLVIAAICGLILQKLVVPSIRSFKEIFWPSPKVHAINENFTVYSNGRGLQVHDHQENKSVYNYKISEEPSQVALPAPLTLPGPCTRLDAMRRAHHDLALDNLFLALGKGDQVKACSLEGFMHVAHDAPTGQGKTSEAYGEMVDLLKLGVRVILANPHFAPVDKKGRDWRPIAATIERQGRLQLAPGASCSGLIRRYDIIARMLKWLSEIELDRRFTMQAQGDFSYKPVYLFIDEWPAIVMRHPEAAQHMIDILQRGRAVEVCVDVSAQGFLSEDVELRGSARENFNTAKHMGGSPYSGAKLLDMTVKEYNALLRTEQVSLGKGIALLRNNETVPQAEVVRLPYADNDYAYYMLGHADGWELPEYRSQERVRNTRGTPEEQNGNTWEQDRSGNAVRNTEEQPVERGTVGVPTVPESGINGEKVPIYVPLEERERIIAAAHAGVARRDMCKHLGKGKYYYEAVRQVLDEEGL